MEGNNLDALGPVDYLVVEFPAEMAAELTTLVDRKLVRVLDLVIMSKDLDGAVAVDELHDVDASSLGQLRALEADLAMLLAEAPNMALLSMTRCARRFNFGGATLSNLRF